MKYGLGLPIGVRVIRKCAIPKTLAPPPVTLGQHLKQHRDRCKQRQKDVAAILGIGHFTYMTWEKDQATPFPRYYPSIIAWLGYNPLPEPASVGEERKRKRLSLGFTTLEMAKHLGCDSGTVERHEQTTTQLSD